MRHINTKSPNKVWVKVFFISNYKNGFCLKLEKKLTILDIQYVICCSCHDNETSE